jgi:4-hydroxy-tetrahydrodipicolinate synthase
MSGSWRGVIPALTTPFDEHGQVDHARLAAHCEHMLEAGCSGVIAAGSLGEGATLALSEKAACFATCAEAAAGRGLVVGGIAALSTAGAVELAERAVASGCDGLMVLPPYAYSTDWREMRAHVSAVVEATPLGCMLYNNPIAYGTDFVPHQIAELAAGASGWVAGLVNAFPHESVALFELALDGDEAVRDLYEWFLPLLRLDTVPKLVQLIKLAQELVGDGPARVRAPRLALEGEERREAERTIRAALERRPVLGARRTPAAGTARLGA